MELQLLDEVDLVDLYADMFPGSADVDKMHPMWAAYEAYLADESNQNELVDSTFAQLALNEGEHEELTCLLFPFVCLTFIIDAEERYVY